MEEEKTFMQKHWGKFIVVIAIVVVGLIFYIDYLNELTEKYKNFVTAFSGLSSVFVATVAIWYSVQANKKQREFQADLQLRQIKVDSYNLRINCWRYLKTLDLLMSHLVQIYLKFYKNNEVNLKKVYFLFLYYNNQQLTLDDALIKNYEVLFLLGNERERERCAEILHANVTCFRLFSQIKIILESNENLNDEICNEDEQNELFRKLYEQIEIVDTHVRLLIDELEKDLYLGDIYKLK